MTRPDTVFVVDDEPMVRDSVCALVRSMGIEARSFPHAEAFLESYRDEPGCVVADLRLPGLSGVELQEELLRRGASIPVIILTANAHTPVVVRAMKNGAVSVLDKPSEEDGLWQAIRDGLALDAQRRNKD